MEHTASYGDQPWLIEFLKDQGFERHVIFSNGIATIHFEKSRFFLTPEDGSMGDSVNLSKLEPAAAKDAIARVLASAQGLSP